MADYPLTREKRTFLKKLLDVRLHEEWQTIEMAHNENSQLGNEVYVYPKFGSDMYRFRKKNESGNDYIGTEMPELIRPQFSLPDMMLRNPYSASFVKKMDRDNWEISCEAHFRRKETWKADVRGLSRQAFCAYLAFVGIVGKNAFDEFERMFKELAENEIREERHLADGSSGPQKESYDSTLSTKTERANESPSENNPFLQSGNMKKSYWIVAILLFTLGLAAGTQIKGCTDLSNCHFDNDPFNILGLWNYEVTRAVPDTLVYGCDPKTRLIKPMYKSINGYVRIDPISDEYDSEYQISGARTEIWRGNEEILKGREMPLTIKNASPNKKKGTLIFKFNVDGDESNQGFVIIHSIYPRDKMVGDIYYLYECGGWRRATIKFTFSG